MSLVLISRLCREFLAVQKINEALGKRMMKYLIDYGLKLLIHQLCLEPNEANARARRIFSQRVTNSEGPEGGGGSSLPQVLPAFPMGSASLGGLLGMFGFQISRAGQLVASQRNTGGEECIY